MNLEIYQLLLALLIGAIIGTEREYRSKSAGLRTMIMVSLASCLFTMLSLRIGVENPDRLAANILTGLGFLGAGGLCCTNLALDAYLVISFQNE